MPTLADFDRYDLTATDLAALAMALDGVKLVHNLTDRGIIPFRKNGRSRLYSFASLLTFDTMIRARGVGIGLTEGAKLAEVVVERAKERIADIYIRLDDMAGWQFLAFCFELDHDPPRLQSYIVDPTEPVSRLQLTASSGWFTDFTSVMPVDRAICECALAYDRHKKSTESPSPWATSAASGSEESGAPHGGAYRHRREADDNLSAGASCPGQSEEN